MKDSIDETVEVVKALPVGTHQEIPEWKISKRTCQEYDYQVTESQGNTVHLAMIRGQDNRVVGVKKRVMPKRFGWSGTNKNTQLFGQHRGDGKHLVITEGEKDAMVVREADRTRGSFLFPVAITSGAAACEKNIQDNLQWIESFAQITLFMDNDEQGILATEKILKILPQAKRVVAFAYKDAGEAWLAGDGQAIRDAITNATRPKVKDVVRADELLEQVLHPVQDEGIPTPWAQWNEACAGGMKKGECWMLAGGTGLGKSAFCRSLALHNARNGIKVAYIGLEEAATTTLERMLSEYLGWPFHLAKEKERVAKEEEVREAMRGFSKNLLLLDSFGSQDLDAFKSTVKHYVNSEQCQIVYLDHFSLLADGISLSADQRRSIDKAIKELKEMAITYHFTFVVVSHLSRGLAGGAGKPHEEGGEPSLSQLRGSMSLAQIPDYIWMLQRNPLDTQNPNKTKCWLKKNRVKGTVGLMGALEFDPKTCRFEEIYERATM